DEALARLKAGNDSTLLAGQITVEPVPGTQLLQVAVHNLPADQAARLANTVVAVFIEQNQAMLAEPYTRRLAAMQAQLDGITAQIEATQLEIKSGLEGKVQAEAELAQLDSQLTADRNDLRSLQQDYEALSAEAAASANAVVVTEQAIADENPAQGRLPFLLLGGVAGLLAGVGLAFVVEQLNDKIRTPQDVRQALGVSPIGLISQRPRQSPELFASTAPSAQTEEFWLLSTSIRLATLDRPVKSLLVTSPTSSEGKSLVAANLAATFARSGERVVLVDADLHFPRLHQIFDLPQEKGLTNLLLDGDVQAHLKPAAVDGLCVLTSGDLPGDVVDIFSLPRLEGVITELTRLADLVIIDCPPVLAVADTSILASFIDGALLVLRSGKSGREVTRSAVERLRKTKTSLLGVVLNSTHQQPPNDYYRSRSVHRNGRVNGKALRESAAAPVKER
ncbi:MAG TPA: CpsD/CapB family tyrosine-protein kinase, partial [Anaerolineaceae bacterium]|nr:CpsD/CapB family tyrosine-protein kinase [Anaerolineaceae bacterium]